MLYIPRQKWTMNEMLIYKKKILIVVETNHETNNV